MPLFSATMAMSGIGCVSPAEAKLAGHLNVVTALLSLVPSLHRPLGQAYGAVVVQQCLLTSADRYAALRADPKQVRARLFCRATALDTLC